MNLPLKQSVNMKIKILTDKIHKKKTTSSGRSTTTSYLVGHVANLTLKVFSTQHSINLIPIITFLNQSAIELTAAKKSGEGKHGIWKVC